MGLLYQGLVKLADFGVATKLTEADINTHSVVGTPYWMAPEVLFPCTPCSPEQSSSKYIFRVHKSLCHLLAL